jgi:hypothetical protein
MTRKAGKKALGLPVSLLQAMLGVGSLGWTQ